MATFNEVWRDILQRLCEGTEIPNWSYESGYTGNATRIERLNYDEVVVTGENTKGPRSVPRIDFQTVFEYWGRYKQGLVPRGEIAGISRNATYILSVLHWLEQPNEAE
jgi:hypothetical protein